MCLWLTGREPSGKEGFELREESKVSVRSVPAYLGCDHDSQKVGVTCDNGNLSLGEIRREDNSGIKQ